MVAELIEVFGLGVRGLKKDWLFSLRDVPKPFGWLRVSFGPRDGVSCGLVNEGRPRGILKPEGVISESWPEDKT
jgi:hypothetical protein